MAHSTDIFTTLDLEMNQPSGKIIQIGAVVGNLRTGEIIEKLSIFVNPNEQLTDYIKKLTKISQDKVDGGVDLLIAYAQLKELHKKHGSFVNFVVWGQGDRLALYTQLKEANPNIDTDWNGGRRELDVKTLYVCWRLANQKHPSGGLSRALANLGLKFVGCAHRADDDAHNTFLAFKELVGRFEK